MLFEGMIFRKNKDKLFIAKNIGFTSQQDNYVLEFLSLPTKSTLWSALESILIAVEAQRQEGKGSRVKFFKGTVKMMTHRPASWQ
jgi:hypothetical protein